MTREECEKGLIERLKDMVDFYHQYAPEGKYLTFCYLEGKNKFYHGGNEYWENGEDEKHPICLFIDEEFENGTDS